MPTLIQLRKLADTYKRSMGVFFLREVPKEGQRIPIDFRRLELSAQNQMSPVLAARIREAQGKRDAALEIYKEIEEAPPHFDLHIPPRTSAEDAARLIAVRLGVSIEARRSWANEYSALSAWRSAVESAGVVVLQVSGVPLTEMRGVAIWADQLPMILLNGADSPLGRLFTLLHELTHLARSESALCDEVEDAPRADPVQTVEAYCNHVAGAMLVPTDALLAHPMVHDATVDSTWGDQELAVLRRFFWASREVILRRLLILNRTSQDHYRDRRRAFDAEYQRLRAARDDGFVPYPRKVVLGNGWLLTRLALSAYSARAITGTELSRMLGAKLDHLPKIAEIMRERAFS